MKIEEKRKTKMRDEYKSMTVEVNTPDGVLYYTICDDDNSPIKVISTFGKAGSSLAAWANAVDILVNMLLEKKVGVNEIIEALSNISNQKPMKTTKGVRVGSGPEGLAVALLEYKRQKYIELRNSFNSSITDEAS